MRASQTVLPFKLTASDESLTAHAGLVLFDEYLGAMASLASSTMNCPVLAVPRGMIHRRTSRLLS
jgi:hypothetical protein